MKRIEILDSKDFDFVSVENFGGKYKILVPQTPRGLRFGILNLEEGESTGIHSHPEEEIFYVIKGNGEFIWKENNLLKKRSIGEGALIYKDSNIKHDIKNTGEKILKGIFCKV